MTDYVVLVNLVWNDWRNNHADYHFKRTGIWFSLLLHEISNFIYVRLLDFSIHTTVGNAGTRWPKIICRTTCNLQTRLLQLLNHSLPEITVGTSVITQLARRRH